MYTKNDLCDTIRPISPDVGPGGVRIKTGCDRTNPSWGGRLKQGHKELKTFVDNEDAVACMDRGNFPGPGLQVFQLKDNLGFKGGSA